MSSPLLPAKEAGLFKQVLRMYENRQFKQGLKTCEQILKKFPEHGETLSMKGLLLNSLDKKEEAYELVKKGLKKDLKSHICWHVYGLLYKSDRNYEEAIKCYRNALKIDKNNFQILRDLSFLLIQTRNYEAFTETRRMFLNSRQQQKASWMGLAVAYYVESNLEQALSVMEAYESTLPELDLTQVDFEHSEFLMFKNMVLIESGKYEQALQQLDKDEHLIFDGLVVRETRAELLLKLGRLSEAEEKIRALIAGNPECKKYYFYLAEALGLKPDNATGLLALYDGVLATHPKAHTPKRLALNEASGDTFVTQMESYLGEWLRKGAPSLFANVRSLCKIPEKLAAVQSLALGYLESLKATGKLKSTDTEKDLPTTLLWTLQFLAQLFDFKGDHVKALEYINEAIAHTPTVVEVVQARARIFKHAGDLQKAMECINQARELDLQDRYINTKCTKYMIRNDRLIEAENTIGLFTKSEPESSPLVDLQCMWYAIETGRSSLRQGQHGKALKKFHQVEKHFLDFIDDQFDFHQYCMRKMTLRAYVKMLKYEDEIRGHKFYFKAAVSAIETYLTLLDKPPVAESSTAPELEGLSEEERKKALSKLRKAEAKAKAQATTAEKAENAKGKAAAKDGKKVDPDPEGALLAKAEDPLAEAIKFLAPLLQFHSQKIETHQLACEVYLRRNKPLMVLRSLKKAKEIDPSDPKMHFLALRFLLALPSLQFHPAVESVIKEEIATLFGGKDAAALNAEYTQQHSKSLSHVLAAAEGALLISGEGEGKKKAASVVLTTLTSLKFSLQEAVAAHQFLEEKLKDQDAANQFKTAAQKLLPLSTYFHGPAVNAHFQIHLRQAEPDDK